MTIDKEKLVELLVEKTGLDQTSVEEQLSELVKKIQEAAEQGKSFEIEGFGTFSVQEEVLHFEPADQLQTEINHKYAGMKPIELMGAYREEEETPEPETEDEEEQAEEELEEPELEPDEMIVSEEPEEEKEGQEDDIWGLEEEAGTTASSLEEELEKARRQQQEIERMNKPEKTEETAEHLEEEGPEPEPDKMIVPEEEQAEEEPEQEEPEEEAVEKASRPTFELDLSELEEDVFEEAIEEEEPELEDIFEELEETASEPETPSPSPKKEKKKKSKDPIGKVLVIFSVLVVLGIGGWAFYEFEVWSMITGATGLTPVSADRTQQSSQPVEPADPAPETSRDQPAEPQVQPGGTESEPAGVSQTEPVYGLRGSVNPAANDGYTIIVHSLGNESRARQVRGRLQQEGYRTIFSRAVVDGNTYWRIGLGQFETVRSAQRTAEELPEPFRSNYFIRRIQ